MRHRKKKNHLGRNKGNRVALLRNLSVSLVENKRLFTTIAKGKELKMFFEPILAKLKKDPVNSSKFIYKIINNKYALRELLKNISNGIKERNGGFLTLIKLNNRVGDNASMCLVKFVDF